MSGKFSLENSHKIVRRYYAKGGMKQQERKGNYKPKLQMIGKSQKIY